MDGKATVDDLSRQVAARRHRITPENLTDEMVKRAQIRLFHTHFPRLIDSSIIHVDWDSELVSLTDDVNVNQLFEAAKVLDGWPPTDLLGFQPSVHSKLE